MKGYQFANQRINSSQLNVSPELQSSSDNLLRKKMSANVFITVLPEILSVRQL